MIKKDRTRTLSLREEEQMKLAEFGAREEQDVLLLRKYYCVRRAKLRIHLH